MAVRQMAASFRIAEDDESWPSLSPKKGFSRRPQVYGGDEAAVAAPAWRTSSPEISVQQMADCPTVSEIPTYHKPRCGSETLDYTWMRMRTPSPERGYTGRAPPPPPETVLSNLMMQPYVPGAAYDSVVSYKPMQFVWWMQAEGETTDGSGVSDSQSAPSDQAQCSINEEKLSDTSESSMAIALVTPEDAPSRGSIGHPHFCQAACKYARKTRGCKDGADCDRCHICIFRNIKPRKPGTEESLQQTLDAIPPPPAPSTCEPCRTRRRRTRGLKDGRVQA